MAGGQEPRPRRMHTRSPSPVRASSPGAGSGVCLQSIGRRETPPSVPTRRRKCSQPDTACSRTYQEEAKARAACNLSSRCVHCARPRAFIHTTARMRRFLCARAVCRCEAGVRVLSQAPRGRGCGDREDPGARRPHERARRVERLDGARLRRREDQARVQRKNAFRQDEQRVDLDVREVWVGGGET